MSKVWLNFNFFFTVVGFCSGRWSQTYFLFLGFFYYLIPLENIKKQRSAAFDSKTLFKPLLKAAVKPGMYLVLFFISWGGVEIGFISLRPVPLQIYEMCLNFQPFIKKNYNQLCLETKSERGGCCLGSQTVTVKENPALELPDDQWSNELLPANLSKPI